MSKIPCILVEDDPIQAELLASYCQEVEQLNLIQTFNSGTKALQFIEKNLTVGLILLDIQMPMMNGIEFLKSMSRPIPTILVTSSEKYAIDAFQFGVLDYLKKPVSFSRFLAAIKKVPQRSGRQKESLFLKIDGIFEKVTLNNVLVFKGAGDYVEVIQKNRAVLANTTLKEVEQQLPKALFMKIHRSHIVNLEAIDKLDGPVVEIGQKVYSCSKAHLESLKEKLGIFK